jgi:hypothetical protein
MDRPYQIHCDAVGTTPVEAYNLERDKRKLVLSSDTSLIDSVRDLTDNARFWLPIASEKLYISPHIKDYVLTPVISMPSDLPNRNGQAFPYKELTGWCTDGGAPMFRTWVGKPAFQEHKNNNPVEAKGVIIDCMMRPIKNASDDIWKVVKLVAWDRTKDSVLANDILSGKSNCYSMGAHAADFSCSVCSGLLSKGGCEHVKHGKPEYKVIGSRLAYYNVMDPIGFELSAVAVPAYASASKMPRFAWLN